MDNNNNLPKAVAEEIYKKNLELLEQRRRSEQLLYGVSEAVFAIDKNFKVTIFNHTAERMLQKKKDEALGKDVRTLIFLETEKNEPIKLEEFCFKDNVDPTKLQGVILKAPGKGFYVNVKSSIIDIADGTKECLVTLTDITREKELEKTKNDFISVTSHELRTPMTIIKSYLWMLGNEKKGPLNDKQKDYLDKAVKGTERMLNLINDTLNISRIEQGKIEFKIEKFNYKEYLNDIGAEFKVRTDEKKLSFKLETDESVNVVYADKNKLREILTNFIGNSVKFTAQGGITIKTEPASDGFVKTSIIDTGRGISKEDMSKLFHKFSKLDNSYQTVAESAGTGLGLYIVKSLIEAMGGQTGAESQGQNLGSTFWFTLPTFPVETPEIKNSTQRQQAIETKTQSQQIKQTETTLIPDQIIQKSNIGKVTTVTTISAPILQKDEANP